MKLAYFSCHAILEYDELRIFEDLGIDYFSFGSYVDPKNPVDPIRPPLTHTVSRDLIDNAPPRHDIPQEFIDQFDTIVIMHVPDWIIQNWDLFKGKRVIWRTIGQSTSKIEQKMRPYYNQGMKIVRYSPNESHLANFAGKNAVIRFYKDENEFNNWNGSTQDVITIAQDMKNRGEFVNYDTFVRVTDGMPDAKLYGTKNDNTNLSGGFLTYEAMKERLRSARVYFYTHSQPACYTLNFMEAMMTGIPVVAVGRRLAESLNIANGTYEVPDIIKNGVNGFISDDITELRGYIKKLQSDHGMAKRIGKAGRETAIELFGMETVKEQWKTFLQI